LWLSHARGFNTERGGGGAVKQVRTQNPSLERVSQEKKKKKEKSLPICKKKNRKG